MWHHLASLKAKLNRQPETAKSYEESVVIFRVVMIRLRGEDIFKMTVFILLPEFSIFAITKFDNNDFFWIVYFEAFYVGNMYVWHKFHDSKTVVMQTL